MDNGRISPADVFRVRNASPDELSQHPQTPPSQDRSYPPPIQLRNASPPIRTDCERRHLLQVRNTSAGYSISVTFFVYEHCHPHRSRKMAADSMIKTPGPLPHHPSNSTEHQYLPPPPACSTYPPRPCPSSRRRTTSYPGPSGTHRNGRGPCRRL